MPYRRRNSNYYWISYVTPEGKQICRSSGLTSHAEAKALEDKLRVQSHEDKQRARTDTRLADVITHYLAAHPDARTRSTARHLVGLLDTWCSAFTPTILRSHIKQRQAAGAQAGTINKEIVLLSAAINSYNLDHGTDFKNPTLGLKLREIEGKLRWLTRAEYTRLTEACDGYLLDFVVLAVQTGMRKGELLPLRWASVDFARRHLTLQAAATKSRRSRVIPLNDEALRVLARRKLMSTSEWVFEGEGASGHVVEIKKGFNAACRRAGLHDVTPHSLRHTTASWLVQAGVPLYEVSKLLGHSSIKMTSRYAHLAPENLRSAVESLV